jgi:hypothetical protein
MTSRPTIAGGRSGPVTVVEVGPDREAAYREFCDRTPGLTIYYTWQFRSFLCDLLKCRPRYQAAVDGGGAVLGILPAMEIAGPFGRVLNSLPFFGSNGGVVAQDETVAALLWRRYRELIDEPGLASATVVGNPIQADPGDVPHDLTDQRVGQVTPLDLGREPEAELARALNPRARRDLKKAVNAGVEVAIDNGALHELAAIHRENMGAIGGRVKPDAFFDLLPKHFRAGADWNVYVARHERRTVAAILFFYAGNTIDYYTTGTRDWARRLEPSSALIFRAMLDAHARGCTIWNWGGTWLSQEGVMYFKRKWGAVDRPYRYFVTVRNAALYDKGRDELLEAYGYFYTLPFDRLRPP